MYISNISLMYNIYITYTHIIAVYHIKLSKYMYLYIYMFIPWFNHHTPLGFDTTSRISLEKALRGTGGFVPPMGGVFFQAAFVSTSLGSMFLTVTMMHFDM